MAEDREATVTQKWVYLGEFDGTPYTFAGNKKAKRVHGWRGPDGKRSMFRKADHAAVGYVYDIEMTLDGESRLGSPKWTGEKADDLEEIRADEGHRKRILEGAALEAKARAQDPDLTELLEHVRAYATRYKKMSAKAALVEMLAREVHRSN